MDGELMKQETKENRETRQPISTYGPYLDALHTSTTTNWGDVSTDWG